MLHGAGADLVLLSVFVVGGDLAPADHDAQRVGHVRHLHAQLRGLLAVQVHRHLRLPQDQTGVDVHDARDLGERRRQARGVLSQPLEVGAADVEGDLLVAHAAARDVRHRGDAGAQPLAGELREDVLPYPFHDFELGLLAIAEVDQLYEDGGEVRRALFVVADQHDGIGHPRELLHLSPDPGGDQLSLLQRGALGGAHVHFELRLIVLGKEVLPDRHEEGHNRRQGEHRGRDNHPAVGHGPGEEPGVAGVEDPEEPCVLRGMAGRLLRREPPTGQHGGDGERHEQRHHDGEGHGGEFSKFHFQIG